MVTKITRAGDLIDHHILTWDAARYIERVPNERVTEPGHVDPDLMRSTRPDPHINDGGVACIITMDHMKATTCMFSGCDVDGIDASHDPRIIDYPDRRID